MSPSSVVCSLLLILFLQARTVWSSACTLCKDGADFTYPDKEFVVIGFEYLGLQSCSSIDLGISLFIPDKDSDDCTQAQSLTTVCGCPRPEDSCDICPGNSTITNPDALLPLNPYSRLFPKDHRARPCYAVEALFHSFSTTDERCLYIQKDNNASVTCGCPGIVADPNHYSNPEDVDWENSLAIVGSDFHLGWFGADDQGLLTLQRLSRTGATLSMFAAVAVIIDNILNRKRLRTKTHHQIMVIMSSFDFLASFFTSLGPVLTPADDILHTDEEKGNVATCRLQGAMVTWGLVTSLLLNASLATFFVLVVVYSWPERKFQKIRIYMIGAPVAIGTILGMSSFPFMAMLGNSCGIAPPFTLDGLESTTEWLGYGQNWGPVLGLLLVPAYVSIIYSTGAVIYVYVFVRKTTSRSKKWSFNMRSHDSNKESGRLETNDKKWSFNMRSRYSNKEAGSRETNELGTGNMETNELGSGGSNLRSARAVLSKSSKSMRNFSKSVLSRNTKRSKLQSEVFWQSFYYLVALHLCSFPNLFLLTFHQKYRMGPFSLWAAVFFLTPLQGFLNSIVYFRSRVSAFLGRSVARVKRQWHTCRTGCCSTCRCCRKLDCLRSSDSQLNMQPMKCQSNDPLDDLQELNRSDETHSDGPALENVEYVEEIEEEEEKEEESSAKEEFADVEHGCASGEEQSQDALPVISRETPDKEIAWEDTEEILMACQPFAMTSKDDSHDKGMNRRQRDDAGLRKSRNFSMFAMHSHILKDVDWDAPEEDDHDGGMNSRQRRASQQRYTAGRRKSRNFSLFAMPSQIPKDIDFNESEEDDNGDKGMNSGRTAHASQQRHAAGRRKSRKFSMFAMMPSQMPKDTDCNTPEENIVPPSCNDEGIVPPSSDAKPEADMPPSGDELEEAIMSPSCNEEQEDDIAPPSSDAGPEQDMPPSSDELEEAIMPTSCNEEEPEEDMVPPSSDAGPEEYILPSGDEPADDMTPPYDEEPSEVGLDPPVAY